VGAINNTTLDAALAYAAGGLSVIPIKRDGSKAPAVGTWKQYQKRLPTEAELREWFDGPDPPGIAIVGGDVSGGLETIDFDKMADSIYPKWCELVEAERPGLTARLCVVRTPRPGFHVRYRCAEAPIPGNCKLAVDPSLPANDRTLIETRGQGGYALAPGGPPECHETGRTYEHVAGPDLTHLEATSADDREVLWRCARSFDREPAAEAATQTGANSAGLRPGDDFNRRGPDWEEILTDWTVAQKVTGGGRYWRRPGKEKGWSATTGVCTSKDGVDLFACFSENAAPFRGASGGRPCSCYSKFAAYTVLNHAGDFQAAAKELARQGYGEQDAKFTTNGVARRHERNGQAGGRAHDDPVPPAGDATPDAPPWPAPLAEEAFHGLAGRIVRTIEPASEADPAALLAQVLVSFGNAVGRAAHFAVEGDRHHGNEFVVLVGKTSKARKGTSWGRVYRLFQDAEQQWADERVQTGLSSGEGLIWAVRDPIYKRERIKERGEAARYEEVEADPGIADKRLLVYEPEFANVLKQTERQGNTLSAVLRVAWDGRDLRSMTKNSPARATGAHVSMVGHITADELRRYLTQTETANGFGNRHLWVCADRSKLLPEGGFIDPTAMAALRDELIEALAFAPSAGDVRRDEDARAVWRDIYGQLSESKPGLAGALLARGEAHVMRLALLYALLDRSPLIGAAHLLAALAFWEYVERSVYHVFGDSLGDPIADELLGLLRCCPAGLTRTDIRDYFQRNASASRIGRALGLLLQHRLARREAVQTGGRPSERWYAVGRKGG
jgi:hypothetical protein